MTREEQIRQAARKYFDGYMDGLKGKILTVEQTFEEGAKWADSHPNLYNDEKYHTVKVSCLDELNRKAVLYDAFLDKACKWMREEFFTTKDSGHDILVSVYWDNVEELIKDFEKQMEE